MLRQATQHAAESAQMLKHAAYCLLMAQAAPLVLPTEKGESCRPHCLWSAGPLAQTFPELPWPVATQCTLASSCLPSTRAAA